MTQDQFLDRMKDMIAKERERLENEVNAAIDRIEVEIEHLLWETDGF